MSIKIIHITPTKYNNECECNGIVLVEISTLTQHKLKHQKWVAAAAKQTNIHPNAASL